MSEPEAQNNATPEENTSAPEEQNNAGPEPLRISQMFEDDPENSNEIDWSEYWILPRVIVNLCMSRMDLMIIAFYALYATSTIYLALNEYCENPELNTTQSVEDCIDEFITKRYFEFSMYAIVNLGYIVFAVVYYFNGAKLYLMDYGRFGYVRRQYEFIKTTGWHRVLLVGLIVPLVTIASFTLRFAEFTKNDMSGYSIAIFNLAYMMYMWYEITFHIGPDVLEMNNTADFVDFNQNFLEDSISCFENFEDAVLALFLRNDESKLREYGINDWEIPIFVNAIKIDRTDESIKKKIRELSLTYLKDKHIYLDVDGGTGLRLSGSLLNKADDQNEAPAAEAADAPVTDNVIDVQEKTDETDAVVAEADDQGQA